MIRIYCDKNIYSSIKPEKKNFIPDLKELMDELKDKVIFTYSRAHHDDLANSDKSYWEEDLLLLEDYVRDHYFYYHPIERKTKCFLKKPSESFYDIDYSKNKVHENIEELIQSSLDDVEEPFRSVFKSLMDSILNLSLPSINETIKTEKDRQILEKYNSKLLSGENQTLKSYLQWGSEILNDKQEVIALKRIMEEYVNSDNYSFQKWKEDYNEKFSEYFKGISFTDMMENQFNAVRGYNDYDKFCLFFSSLDIFNITKDKPLRKTQAFANTTIDSDHAWYGSFSDFLVTNDKGLIVKSYITYKYFGIHTEICSVEDFLNKKTVFLNQEETNSTEFTNNLKHELDNAIVLKKINGFDVLKTNHFFFNYFNRIMLKNNSILFYSERLNNIREIMLREVELLVNKVHLLFGPDDENKLLFSFEKEKVKENEVLRQWSLTEITVLFYINNNEKIQSCCLELIKN